MWSFRSVRVPSEDFSAARLFNGCPSWLASRSGKGRRGRSGERTSVPTRLLDGIIIIRIEEGTRSSGSLSRPSLRRGCQCSTPALLASSLCMELLLTRRFPPLIASLRNFIALHLQDRRQRHGHLAAATTGKVITIIESCSLKPKA